MKKQFSQDQKKAFVDAANPHWTCRGLVPDHGLSVKRRCAHNPEGFSIEVQSAASADYRNH